MTWGTYLEGVGAGALAIVASCLFALVLVWCMNGRWWRRILGLLLLLHVLAFSYMLRHGRT